MTEKQPFVGIVDPSTAFGAGFGLCGGALVSATAYESSLGRSQYDNAQIEIGDLQKESASFNSTRQVIVEKLGSNDTAVRIIDSEIAQRQEKIASISAHSPHYNYGDAFTHTVEFGAGGALLLGALTVAARYTLHRRRQGNSPQGPNPIGSPAPAS